MWPYSSRFWSLGFPSSIAHHGYTVTVASTVVACRPSTDVFCSFPHGQHFREGCFSLFIAFYLSRHKRQLHCSWRNFCMCSTKQGQRRRELVSTEHLSHARSQDTYLANISFHLHRYPIRYLLSSFYRWGSQGWAHLRHEGQVWCQSFGHYAEMLIQCKASLLWILCKESV